MQKIEIPFGSDIIIYGAGKCGQYVVSLVSNSGNYNLIGVADRDYRDISLIFPELNVINPELIINYSYDYIIIAIENEQVEENIIGMLCDKDIAREKIVSWSSIDDHDITTMKYGVDGKKVIARNLGVMDRKIWLFMLPEHGNMGDYAIGYAEEKFFSHYFPCYRVSKVTTDEWLISKKLISQLVQKGDVIFLNGGGYIGDLWDDTERYRSIIEAFPGNTIFFFPNTLTFKKKPYDGYDAFENELKWFESKQNVYVMFRDAFSYTMFSKWCNRSFLFPDMVLFMHIEKTNVNKNNRILLCFRNDRECIRGIDERVKMELENKGIAYDNIDLCIPRYISIERGRVVLDNMIKMFQQYDCMITDRLHGMLLSIIGDVPCLAYDNTTNKVSGVFDWVKNTGFVAMGDENDFCGLEDEIKRIISSKLIAGDYEPPIGKFDEMAKRINEITKLLV